MAFHPLLPLLAAGDKQGNFSLWNIEDKSAATFSIHSQYISALHWREHALTTASYDGSIRMLDINQGQWTEVQGLSPDIEISAMDCCQDAR